MPTINKKPLILNRSTRKEEKHKLYNNSQWIKLSKLYRQQNPLCEECLKNDIVTPASSVHHKQSPFDGNISEVEQYRRLLNWNNLESVCHQCHQKIHEQQEKLKKMRNNEKKSPKKDEN